MNIPSIPQTFATPPEIPVTVLPDGVVYKFPAVFGVYFSGSGAMTVEVSGSMVMGVQFDSAGSLSPVVAGVHEIQEQFNSAGAYTAFVRPLESLTADFNSVGGMSAYLEEFTGIDAPLSGEGFLGSILRPVIIPDFAGVGEMQVTPGVAADFMDDSSLFANIEMVGILNANFAGEGVYDAELVSFSPMGMDKNTNQSISSNSTVTIGPWVERSGFPATEIVSNALVSNGSSESVVVNARLELTSNWSNSTALQVRILKNGVQIGSNSIGFQGRSATFSPINTSLDQGDQISMQVTVPFGASGTVLAGPTATYVYYNET